MLIRRGFKPCRDADPGRAVAIGNFDGVHLGHQAILAVLRERGRAQRLRTAVVCFEPQPKEFFARESAPARLMRPSDKAERIAEAGIDELRVLVGGVRGAEPRPDREHEIGLADDRIGSRLAEVAG